MPNQARPRRFPAPFSKARSVTGKITVSRIQRRARDLMSVASVLAFCTVMAWLLIAMGLWQASGTGPAESSSMHRLLEHWHMMPNRPFNASLLALAWLLAFVATMTPIVCLRRLGKALYTQPPLSFAVARRFLWLGRALVINIVIGFAASWVAASQIEAYQITFSLGFWGTVIAAILAYVVAELVREGARAIEENREFV
ncbi:hypothetical protein [Rhodanobacter lindaniclasticus]